MKSIVVWCLLFIFLLPLRAHAIDIVLPGVKRQDYFTELLELALSYHPEKQYNVKFIDFDVPKLRAFKLIAANQGIDVIAAGATIERQAILHPVKIPLLKGLFGWRVALVHEDNLSILKDPESWQKFKTLSAGQLLTWSDTQILESNGINVVKGANYQGLFVMLDKKRFDYFPRSILEIEQEYKQHRHFKLAIDPHVLLHYPTAYYFYVNQDNLSLATDLQSGLEMAIKEGRFEQLFQRYYGNIIAQFIKQNRRVIELDNPFLPKDAPLQREELWLTFFPPPSQHIN